MVDQCSECICAEMKLYKDGHFPDKFCKTESCIFALEIDANFLFLTVYNHLHFCYMLIISIIYCVNFDSLYALEKEKEFV
jgi:hypothetical protein